MNDFFGYIEGEICGRNGCDGMMVRDESYDDVDARCRCHTAPPCSYCVDAVYVCIKCGINTEMDED